MIIVAPDGTEVECFVAEHNGMIDALLRADTEEVWTAAAISAEILEYATARKADGSTETFLRPVKGNNIGVLGPVIITPGEYDEEGNELVAPVMDNRYHVNLRVAEPALSKVNDGGYPKWKETVLAWMNFGVDDTTSNKNEVGKKLSAVTLIDPTSIQTPAQKWL